MAISAKESTLGSDEIKRKELYYALSNQRTFVWQIYLFSIALFSVFLNQRRSSPGLVSGMTMELFIAFTVVTASHYSVLVFNSEKVIPPWVCGLYQMVGPMGIWFFTAGWMTLYAIHIPLALYQPKQWGITVFFVLLTLTMSVLSKVARCAFLFGSAMVSAMAPRIL